MFQVNPLLQRIHMKNQAIFSSKDKSEKLNVVGCDFCMEL